ncbi:uncharacterized protein [Lolium perenne]|uniref:uncharacterized protein n=1 Tax=Lolium perenne TaxID=4522 RepID=UPI0021F6497B|nr:GATA transcription factor 16-like [Lolium perenne]
MDSSVEKGSGSLDPDGRAAASGNPKACTDCYATKTPLWRGGPEGPKSLCNACGIRYRKKRREALGLDGPKRREPVAAADAACAEDAGGEEEEEDEEQQQQPETTKKSKRVGPWGKVTVELRMVGFGKDAVLKQRRRMRRKRRLGEEEKAAILLMALSSGVIYAS